MFDDDPGAPASEPPELDGPARKAVRAWQLVREQLICFESPTTVMVKGVSQQGTRRRYVLELEPIIAALNELGIGDPEDREWTILAVQTIHRGLHEGPECWDPPEPEWYKELVAENPNWVEDALVSWGATVV